MYLIYVDEAGNTGANLLDPQQPYHLILALLVPDKLWHEIEAEMSAIVAAYVPELDRSGFEFHAVDLHHGNRYFRTYERGLRTEIAHRILSIVPKFGLHIIYAACHKPRLAGLRMRVPHPHNLAFAHIADMCERYLAGPGGGELGIVVADHNRDREAGLHASLRRYRQLGVSMGIRLTRLDHIIENIHFQASDSSYFLQIADLCAYYITRYLADEKRDRGLVEVVTPRVWESVIVSRLAKRFTHAEGQKNDG